MTPEQRREFEHQGLTCLRGAVAPDLVARMRDRVWERAEARLGMRRGDPSTWRRVAPSIVKKLKQGEGLFDPILSPTVTGALDSLLGAGGWIRPEPLGTLIMTPPHPGEWRLPSKMWHLDAPAPGWVDAAVPAVQIFLLLDRLAPYEGGTLVAGGSYRLVQSLPERQCRDYEGHSGQIRKALGARVPWLRELWSDGSNAQRIERLVARTSEHEDVPLRVLEMTGEPGDVYLMHIWTLHAGSMNSSERMRMMVNAHLFGRGQPLWAHSRR
jgi:hypothetical protein